MHAKITVGDKGPVVEDLNSINGTFVNGQKIKQPTQIVVGDRLRFHETEFCLEKLVDPDATIVCMNVVDPDATLFAGAIIKDAPIKTAEKNNPSVRAPIRESFEGQLKNDSTNNQEVKKLSAIQRQVNYGAKPQDNKISQLEVGMWVEFLGNRGKNEIYCLVSKGTSKDSSFSFMKQNGFKVVKKERKRPVSHYSFYQLVANPLTGIVSKEISPLANPDSYPENIGLIGYFNIMPNKVLVSPLLPYQSREQLSQANTHLKWQEIERRIAIKNKLQTILIENKG